MSRFPGLRRDHFAEERRLDRGVEMLKRRPIPDVVANDDIVYWAYLEETMAAGTPGLNTIHSADFTGKELATNDSGAITSEPSPYDGPIFGLDTTTYPEFLIINALGSYMIQLYFWIPSTALDPGFNEEFGMAVELNNGGGGGTSPGGLPFTGSQRYLFPSGSGVTGNFIATVQYFTQVTGPPLRVGVSVKTDQIPTVDDSFAGVYAVRLGPGAG